MKPAQSVPAQDVYRQLTAEEVKARGPRNLAIAGLLIFLVVLFFFVTLIRLGGNVADRSL
ncbi:MAG TPA: hypothetical protein DCL54_16170 [Alphaproteobacteria bacterium]|nr:hypothetical protein [Alphaproteobacteria bacterium]HAJ48109.1 hypothetical protein [Alphaproteobacteria bacterium]